MNDKVKLGITCFVAVLLLITLGIFGFTVFNNREVLESLPSIGIAGIVLVITAVFLFRNYKAASKGLPLDDEMSTLAKWKAGAYTYFASIYLWLAFGWSDSFGLNLTISHVAALVVGLSAIMFLGLWLYFLKFGGDEVKSV